MALRGLLPVVHSFACFLSTRPNEQIYNNATERTEDRVRRLARRPAARRSGPLPSVGARHLGAGEPCPGWCCSSPRARTKWRLRSSTASRYEGKAAISGWSRSPARSPTSCPTGYRLAEGRGVALTEGEDADPVRLRPIMLAQAYEAAVRLRAERGRRADGDQLAVAQPGRRLLAARDARRVPAGLYPR